MSVEYIRRLLAGDGWESERLQARLLIRAYRKRWARSAKRCPPGFAVCIPPNSGGISAVACGLVWDERKRRFEADSFDGLGKHRRAEARANAWAYYEETWQTIHDLLSEAGLFDVAAE